MQTLAKLVVLVSASLALGHMVDFSRPVSVEVKSDASLPLVRTHGGFNVAKENHHVINDPHNSGDNSFVLMRGRSERDPNLSSGAQGMGQLLSDQHGIGRISVVLPCANTAEDVSQMLKTVQSFCDRTPANVLHEIIVVDDGSEISLAKALDSIHPLCKATSLRHNETMGLMVAKQTGGDAATGQFIGFFDCHVAPNLGWHEEIIQLLQDKPQRLVVPVISVLDIDKWTETEHTQEMTKCYVDWNADFWWYDDKSPFMAVISGGLVATSRDWWRTSGGFDEGLRGWGGENIDQSLRAWLCGGDIVRARSSHVAHMFRNPDDPRTAGHYKLNPGFVNNTARVAAAWFGDFAHKFHKGSNPIKSTDVSSVLEKQKALKCQPYSYYLHRFRKLYRDGGMLPAAVFGIQDPVSQKCVQASGDKFILQPCDFPGFDLNQPNLMELTGGTVGESQTMFHFANQNPAMGNKCCSGIRLWNSLSCLDRLDHDGPLSYQCDIIGGNEHQQWRFDGEGRLRYGHTGFCVSAAGEGLTSAHCEGATQWKLIAAFKPEETRIYEADVQKYNYTEDMPDH